MMEDLKRECSAQNTDDVVAFRLYQRLLFPLASQQIKFV